MSSEGLGFSEYQEETGKTAVYPKDTPLKYLALGITGEAGEISEKVKKKERDGELSKEDLAKEIGDVLWYLAQLAEELDRDLGDIAQQNLERPGTGGKGIKSLVQEIKDSMETKSPEEAEVLVQKLSSDMGIHRNPRKGTLNAPEEILENFDFKRKVLFDEVFPDEFDLEETQRRIYENTGDLAEYDKPIVSIGGDHSVSFPVIKALKEENPEMKLVWLDAHLDLKEKVGDHVSHDVVVRELLESGFDEGEIVFVGITRKDEDEKEFLKEHDLEIYGPQELEKFKREFDWSEQPVYLSVDIDVLSQEEAPGTGYPDGALPLEEVEEVIETVRPSHGDLVEVAPPFDKDGKTVENARRTLSNLLKMSD